MSTQTATSDVAQIPPFPQNRVIREGDTKPRAAKAPRASVSDRLRPLLLSALFWYACLACVGTLVASTGVGLQFGLGYGLMVGGALLILGAEVVRAGMTRV